MTDNSVEHPFKRIDEIYPNWRDIVDKIMEDSKFRQESFKWWLCAKENLNGYFFSSLTYRFLWEVYCKVHHRNEDHFIVIAGREGCGKSFLALQMAAVLDESFNIKRVCYDMQDYIREMEHAKKGQVFILDEGNMFLFGREAMQKHNIDTVKLFALMRQKNLITIICVPNFFTLDSYVRKHRTNTLFYIHKRGAFVCYRSPATCIISDKGKYSNMVTGHKLPPGTYWAGGWNGKLPSTISWKDYTKKKSKKYDSFIQELKGVYNKSGSVILNDIAKELKEQTETKDIEEE